MVNSDQNRLDMDKLRAGVPKKGTYDPDLELHARPDAIRYDELPTADTAITETVEVPRPNRQGTMKKVLKSILDDNNRIIDDVLKSSEDAFLAIGSLYKAAPKTMCAITLIAGLGIVDRVMYHTAGERIYTPAVEFIQKCWNAPEKTIEDGFKRIYNFD